MSYPSDRCGRVIIPGASCWLPWGWGKIASPGNPRTLITYPDGQELEVLNTLIEIRSQSEKSV